MSNNSIIEILEEFGCNIYPIASLGDTLTTGIDLYETDNFIKFVKDSSIKNIFVYQEFAEADDFYISLETIKEVAKYEDESFLEFIFPMIEKYNDEIFNIDFNNPLSITVVFFYESKPFYTEFVADICVMGEPLTTPEEKLKNIINENNEHREEIQQKNIAIFMSLKEELHDRIFNDENFHLCTNEKLRSGYAHDLFYKLDSKYKPIKEIMYTKKLPILSRTGREFFELIWREVKESKKKIKSQK